MGLLHIQLIALSILVIALRYLWVLPLLSFLPPPSSWSHHEVYFGWRSSCPIPSSVPNTNIPSTLLWILSIYSISTSITSWNHSCLTHEGPCNTPWLPHLYTWNSSTFENLHRMQAIEIILISPFHTSWASVRTRRGSSRRMYWSTLMVRFKPTPRDSS